MQTAIKTPEINEQENHPFFAFKTDALLLPEHSANDFPEQDFLAYGTSDDDLQF